jgi:hypothetical protein
MKNRNNIIAVFVIPLTIGLIVAFFQLLLPTLVNNEKKELTFSISNPISLINNNITKDLNIKINDVQTQNLYSCQITIENTGKIPLKSSPTSILYQNVDSTFIIYNTNIETIPEYEFGEITVSKSKEKIRLIIELLNPHDKIILSVLSNKNIRPEFYSKVEGMELIEQTNGEKEDSIFSIVLVILVSGISMFLLVFLQSKGYISLFFNGVKINFDTLNNAKSETGLKILFATYGKYDKIKDVVPILNNKIIDNHLKVKADNLLFGDPALNIRKELKVVYSNGKEINTIRVNENDELELPILWKDKD